MFEPFHKLPQGAIKRSGHTVFFAQVRDGPVHEVHFRSAPRKNVLQHAGFMFAERVSAFLHQGARITVQLDPERLGYRFTFGDQGIEQLARRSEPRRRAVVQERQRANRIRRSVED